VACKKMKRKLGKKVRAGSMTVDEARARLGRTVAQKSYGSAWSTWPEQAAVSPPREPDWEYVLEAARAKIVLPPRPQVAKVRKTAAQKRYDRDMAPAREAIAKALNCTTTLAPPAAPVVVKQLSQPERATVAEFRRLAGVTRDPFKREYYNDQVARITGETFTWGAV